MVGAINNMINPNSVSLCGITYRKDKNIKLQII